MGQWARFTCRLTGTVFLFESPVSQDAKKQLHQYAEDCGAGVTFDDFDPSDYFNIRTYDA